ncbi:MULTISPECIES: PHA/PHB synthase family protein [Sphingomonas]|jgi:polyhydroxyalkanoate synthase|uniref:Poly(R)-hydroxyalkanoic acid synthase n=1 Tax=Sphingomonas hankookensis TaxID=563996 RepID=A0ABR5YF21_9SPHN|nr:MULTISPECIES: class I poly(R)-hydroxyalkanoic acid synthase [Sphingomonas]KZE17993.1 poly(R)-hydroxyalkanoic acid synthase [Sphingomonas hankookensis]PZT93547.1 MAG: class I poly(R)-hydroxyalkanoic acid synthase [Sphingomonas sp.]
MTAESNMPPTTPMSLEDLQHWTQMLGRAQQMMLEQGIDLLERTPAIPDPTGMVKAQTDFWADTMKLWQRFLDPANAEPVEESPERARDKRFKAKQWHDDPLFAFIRQSYFLVADHMLKSVDALDGVEPKQKEQLRFATRGLIDAMSPTNFPATNPVVVEKIIETRGENLLKGLQNMLADMAKGQMTQSDTSAFELGRNVATTPGKVIKRTALYELIHYAPTTETVGAIPLLIFPPWINRFYILDLTAEKSFIRWAVEQGLSVFVVSWKSADASMKDVTWDDYVVRGQIDAIDTVRDLLGVESVHTIGYCVAGTTLAATLALLAARGEAAKVATATFFTAQVDFSQAGELSLFVDDEQLKLIRQVGQDGYLDGRYMAATFNLLRGRDLIWNYVTNNYLLGNDYAPFDLLHWNADVANLPANWHLGYLTDLYRDNRLVQAGSMTVDEVPIDLSTVKTPAYIQAGREDHIAPAESVWKVTEHFTGPLRFVLAGSGHIAGVVNPPSAGKYQYWTNDEAADSLEAFVAGAKETKGSWWPDWRAWIAAADGATVPATGARVPGEGAMPALCDAPGEYVRTR